MNIEEFFYFLKTKNFCGCCFTYRDKDGNRNKTKDIGDIKKFNHIDIYHDECNSLLQWACFFKEEEIINYLINDTKYYLNDNTENYIIEYIRTKDIGQKRFRQFLKNILEKGGKNG